MKAGVKEMKKEYKKVNIDKIEDLQVNGIPTLFNTKVATKEAKLVVNIKWFH